MQLADLLRPAALVVISGFVATPANATTVAITEWMYSGDEFIEFTNLTGGAIDFTGWSFDDDSRTPGVVSLSAFGLVAAGESVILAEASAADFRTRWGLAPTVKVIGNNATNLGRNDEINLYNATNQLVDRLTFGDQTFPGTIRTQDRSGNPTSLAVLALDTVTADGWVLSSAGDAFGSYNVGTAPILTANPGQFALVPVPAALPLFVGGLAGLIGLRRRGA
jgi:predicted extracellular nuclease